MWGNASIEMEEKEIPKLLLQTMHNIAKYIKEMRLERQKESPRGFHHGESSDTSHSWCEKPSLQHSTMPTFLSLEGEVGGPLREETLGDYFVEYEFQSQRFKEHLNFQEFCWIKDGRRSSNHHKGGGYMQNQDL